MQLKRSYKKIFLTRWDHLLLLKLIYDKVKKIPCNIDSSGFRFVDPKAGIIKKIKPRFSIKS